MTKLTYDEIFVPSDIQEFGQRHKIPTFADATYRNGYMDGAKEISARIDKLEVALLSLIEMAEHQASIYRASQRRSRELEDKTKFAVMAEPWENKAMAGRALLQSQGKRT